MGLNDLKTESEHVRSTIAAYLQDLLDVGVVGFRVDAAKHMPAADLENIMGRLSGDPYVTHEVIYSNGSGEPITPDEYYGSGSVQQFDYGRWMQNHFTGVSKASYLLDLGEDWGLSPDDKAQVFVRNHDTERGGEAVNFLDYYNGGEAYLLANAYMMAHDYGVPAQMTDYEYTSTDQGPPLTGGTDSAVADVDCDAADTGRWACQHRGGYFGGMAGFRSAVAGEAITDQWHNDENAFAFGRGTKGYIAINAESSSVNRTFTTSLPAGQYCNVLGGDAVTVESGENRSTTSQSAGQEGCIQLNGTWRG